MRSRQFLVLAAILAISNHAAVDLLAQDLILKVGEKPPSLLCKPLNPNFTGSLLWKHLKGTVVIVDFWATWCPPCIASIPRLDSLVEDFRDQPVRFLSITYEPETIVTPFLAKHPMNSAVCIDKDFATFRSYKAWGIPMAVLVNKSGIIAAVVHPSRLTSEMIREVLSGATPRVEQAHGWSDPKGAEQYFRSTISPMKR
jgi:thiol-disulfide isomerase/thioredoxin